MEFRGGLGDSGDDQGITSRTEPQRVGDILVRRVAEGGQAHGHIADGSPEHPDASKLQTQVCEGIMILSGRQRLSRKAEPNIDWERNI